MKSHSGANLARAFGAMLRRHGLEEKVCRSDETTSVRLLTVHTNQILAVIADNATSNDTMITHLDGISNAFDELNRVRCFNHTLQLSAKTLLKPFNAGVSSSTTDNAEFDDGLCFEGEEDDEEGAHDEELGHDDEDSEDELADLDEYQRADLMEKTAVVRTVVSKVCLLSRYVASMKLILHDLRFASWPSQSYIQPPLRYQPGVEFVKTLISNRSLSLAMSSPDGTLPMTC